MTRRRAGRRLRSGRNTTTGVDARLINVLRRLDAAAPESIGYRVAADIDYRPLAPFLRHLLNNIGDPHVDPIYFGHAKDLEREMLDFYAHLFRAPDGWAGYVTSGGSEGNLHGLWLAWTKYPNAIVYHCGASHYSVAKACHLLGLPSVGIAHRERRDRLHRLAAAGRPAPGTAGHRGRQHWHHDHRSRR
jgi:histidine decarboxylase